MVSDNDGMKRKSGCMFSEVKCSINYKGYVFVGTGKGVFCVCVRNLRVVWTYYIEDDIHDMNICEDVILIICHASLHAIDCKSLLTPT